MTLKQIFIFIAIISFISIVSYFLFRNSNKSGGSGGGSLTCPPSCPNKCDENGNCIEPSKCGPKPNDTNTCTFICDSRFNQWRCKTSCDDKDKTDYSSCNDPVNLGCDDVTNQFYCKEDSRCNKNGSYYLQNQVCKCSPQYTGIKCNCKKIENCSLYNDDTCVCENCRMQYYYGDNCTACVDKNGNVDTNQVFKNGSCDCIDSTYYKDRNGKCIQSKKTCVNGGTFDKDGNCVCIVKDGTQYYGDTCQYASNCYKKEEFVIKNGVASCDCTKNKDLKCGQNCSQDPGTCQNGGTMGCKSNDCSSCSCDCHGLAEGQFCQCLDSQKPTVDTCKGEQNTCGPNGWITTKVDKCSDLYNMNGGSEKSWMQNCTNKQCNNPEYVQTLKCNDDDVTKTVDITCESGCPTTLPTTDCNTNKKDKTKNYVWECDSTTNHEYKCVEQQLASSCAPVSPYFCLDKNPPECYICGQTNQTELVCSGTSPSRDCLVAKYGSSVIEHDDPNGVYWTNNKSSGALPIYPTIDNTLCQQQLDPTDFLNEGTFNGSDVFNSAKGYVENNKFTPYNDPSVKYTYAFNKNATYSNDINCWWKDSDIASYLGDPGQSLCRNNGKFNQSSNSIYKLKDGTCTCNLGFLGKNCQYSNAETCSKNGNVSIDSSGNPKCSCNPGFFGTNCNLTNANCVSQPGVESGIIKGANGNVPICDFSSLCSIKFPRCGTCSNTDNYQNMTCTEAAQVAGAKLFTTPCIARPDGTPSSSAVYGCPVNKNTSEWSVYTGIACADNDGSGLASSTTCNSGSSLSNVYGSGIRFAYCHSPDFKNIPMSSIETINTNGLQDRGVSGVGIAINTSDSKIDLVNISGNSGVNNDNNAFTTINSSNAALSCGQTDGDLVQVNKYLVEHNWF